MDQIKLFIITSFCCWIGIIIGIILLICKLTQEGTLTILFSLYIQLMAVILIKWWWGDGF